MKRIVFKNKKLIFFIIFSITAIFALIYMPSHSRYYGDNTGSLVISGQLNMQQTLLTYKILESEHLEFLDSTSYDAQSTDEYGDIAYSNENIYSYGYFYTGESPDNYLWYNCDDTYNGVAYGEGGYNYSAACERWRIVSMSSKAEYVKIIPDTSTLNYKWNDSSTVTNFTSSTLYTNLQNWRTNNLSTASNNFAVTSLTEHAPVSSSINGYNSDLTSLTSYMNNYSVTQSVKVSIISALDYYYIKDWLNVTAEEWTIQRYSSMYANYIKTDGTTNIATLTNEKAVRPAIYLKKDTIVKGGSGTYTSPYTLVAGYSTSSSYDGHYTKFVAPKKGYYYMEISGAQGGNGMTNGVWRYAGGGGSTASGYINLSAGEVLYFYLGSAGGIAMDEEDGYGAGGWNGGGTGGNDSNYASSGNEYAGGGGGATDIRCFYNASTDRCEENTTNLEWDDELGLNSRIMVAAGGGGGAFAKPGGDGGAIIGGNSYTGIVQATQTSGGAFGIGQDGIEATGGCGGGGGGYWGGSGGSSDCNGHGGSGGSSYVSGLNGYIAITSETDRTPRTVTGEGDDSPDGTGTVFSCADEGVAENYNECSHHYSGKIFEYGSVSSGENNRSWIISDLEQTDENATPPTEWGPMWSSMSVKFVGSIGYEPPPDAYPYDIGFVATGTIQEWTVPITGYYFLEVMGAQGGQANHWTGRGGYGGYASGVAFLEAGTLLYIVVGGMGSQANKSTTTVAGGYNGGGNCGGYTDKYTASGGGATHIATVTGLLKELSGYKGVTDGGTTASDKILIVGGGGGGGGYESTSKYGVGGNAGGYKGATGGRNSGSYTRGTGGTQTAAGGGGSTAAFGRGGNRSGGSSSSTQGTGGGGGWFGGGGGQYYCGGGGGSSYIGSSLLIDAQQTTIKSTGHYTDWQYRQLYGSNVTEYYSTDEKLYTTASDGYFPSNHGSGPNVGTGYAMIRFLLPAVTEPKYS